MVGAMVGSVASMVGVGAIVALGFGSAVGKLFGADIGAVAGAAGGDCGGSVADALSAAGRGVPANWPARADCTAAVTVASMFGVGTGVLVPRICSKRWPNSGSDHFPSGVGSVSEAPRTPQAADATNSKAATIMNAGIERLLNRISLSS